jgi:PAS domain S-box-containing protein
MINTNERQAEEALRRGDERLRLITDSLPVLIAYIDGDHCYRFVNKVYEQWFGLSPAEIVGRHVREVNKNYELIRPHLEKALQGETVSFEVRAQYPRTGTRDVSAVFVPHKDENGHTAGLYTLVTDITERKQGEQALRRSEARILRHHDRRDRPQARGAGARRK